MIKNGVPVCDFCKKELVALTEEECLNDIESHGWPNWKTAEVHSCNKCFNSKWQPPCEMCDTAPCTKGRECWANPPLHIFPYETYFADRLNDSNLPEIDEDFDLEEPIDLEARKRQIMLKSGEHPNQTKLLLKNSHVS